jgi:hypothetical protein
MVRIVPVKQKTNRFNPDEIRATEISLGKRDKFGWLGAQVFPLLNLKP